MGISVEDAVKELQARETVFVAYSQATKLPYVTCGEETYNDQVWLFADEEKVKAFGKEKAKEKIVLAYSGGLDTSAIIPWLKETYYAQWSKAKIALIRCFLETLYIFDLCT